MGLDMYLSGKRYMSKYFDPADAERIAKVNEVFGIEGEEDGDFGAQEVTFRVSYWRKANAIHKWFVDKCQDGVDECQETWVTREQLQELADTCRAVIADTSKAGELLPPSAGFFFGSTDVDEWYLQDLEFTAGRMDKILNDPSLKGMEFYYQSSW